MNDLQLPRFYDSLAGRCIRRALTRALYAMGWQAKGQIAVVGFPQCLASIAAAPQVQLYLWDTVSRVPPPWPREGHNQAQAIGEKWPLPDVSLEQIVLVHAVEHAARPADLLQEAWRTLMGEGNLWVIVPRRLSFWSWAEHTPFGQGRPYSRGQISTLLVHSGFKITSVQTALFGWPWLQPLGLRLFNFMEYWGRLWRGQGGGVWVIKAEKNVYGVRPTEETAKGLLSSAVQVLMPAASANIQSNQHAKIADDGATQA